MKNDKEKLLVVDDDFNNYIIIKELLSKYNIIVLYASCGIEAFEQCLNNNLALILMDIRMKGINGFETALHIKSIRKNIPIVFQTAYAKDFAKDDLMKNIGNGFLEKPIKTDTLLQEVKKYININLNDVPLKKESSIKLKNIFSFLFY
jgi:CheY-like chemotaxis protein